MNKEKKVKEVPSECDYFHGQNPVKDNDTSPNGSGKAFPSKAQRDGEAFLWSECGY